jgi:class 3 adenylate cyclase
MGRWTKTDEVRIAEASLAYDREKKGKGHAVTLALIARRYNLTEVQLVNFRRGLKNAQEHELRVRMGIHSGPVNEMLRQHFR